MLNDQRFFSRFVHVAVVVVVVVVAADGLDYYRHYLLKSHKAIDDDFLW